MARYIEGKDKWDHRYKDNFDNNYGGTLKMLLKRGFPYLLFGFVLLFIGGYFNISILFYIGVIFICVCMIILVPVLAGKLLLPLVHLWKKAINGKNPFLIFLAIVFSLICIVIALYVISLVKELFFGSADLLGKLIS